MSINARLVILPQWLLKVLETNNLTLDHALDVTSLSRVLSPLDVGKYAGINEYLFSQLNKPLVETFCGFSLLSDDNVRLADNHGQIASGAQAKELRQRLFRIMDEYYVTDFAEPKKANPILLLDPMSKIEVSHESSMAEITENYLFDVVLIKDDIYGIQYRPRDESLPQLPQLISCYDKVLKLLTGIHGFEAVAGTSVFNEYASIVRRAAVW